MTRLRRFAIAALAAATVTVGSMATVPTATALPMSCAQKSHLAASYWATGVAFYSIGAYWQATYWWGKADGIMVGC